MSPPINPNFPIGAVNHLEDLMDLATGMERAAADRYAGLAAAVAAQGEMELAALFRSLEALERDHENGIARWARREGGPTPTPAEFPWRLPETFEGEAEGAEGAVLTPYRALAAAVRNEEQAFVLYTYVAAMAEDPVVRGHAESLAREELAHVSLLRGWRRRAFHDQAAASGPRARPIRSLAELHARADALDAEAAALDGAAADSLAAAGLPAAALVLRRCAEGALVRIGARNGRPTAPPSPPPAASPVPRDAVRRCLRHAEGALNDYLAAAERPSDELLLTAAHRLAEAATARLACVRSVLPDTPE